MRLGVACVATAATAVASLASAQEWSVQSGATARIEYNDNYFFTSSATQSSISGSSTPVGTQSAFTGTITPFITAARRTETSDVTALIAIGANKVWGLSPTVDYLSGNFGLIGSLREARSTWTGNASFVRSASLQNETEPDGNHARTRLYQCRYRDRHVHLRADRALVARCDGRGIQQHLRRRCRPARRCPTITATTPAATLATPIRTAPSSPSRPGIPISSAMSPTATKSRDDRGRTSVFAAVDDFRFGRRLLERHQSRTERSARHRQQPARKRRTVRWEHQLCVLRAHAVWRQRLGKPGTEQFRHPQRERQCRRFADSPVFRPSDRPALERATPAPRSR